EGDESPEECIEREVLEETNLTVKAVRFLGDCPDISGGSYERLHTYLCEVNSGEASPGFEPEEEAAAEYAISALDWLSLHERSKWEEIGLDGFSYGIVSRITEQLGY